MDKIGFNPVNSLISLVVGWFFMSFLQTLARSLMAGAWSGFGQRILDIALFRDGPAVLINIACMVVFGLAGTALYLKFKA